MGIGQKLQNHRIQKGLTQRALAQTTGIAQANLSNIEMGKQDLNFGTLKRICFALEVPAWQVVQEAEDTPKNFSLSRKDVEDLSKAVLGEDARRPRAIKQELVTALRRIFSMDKNISDRQLNQSWMQALGTFSHAQIKTIGDRVKDQRLRTS